MGILSEVYRHEWKALFGFVDGKYYKKQVTIVRVVKFYEDQENRKVNRKLIVFPFLNPGAIEVAEKLGIEVFWRCQRRVIMLHEATPYALKKELTECLKN